MASAEEPVVLWCLRGHGRDVRCLQQKTRAGLELRVLWGNELFLTETFRDADRLTTRAEEFRATLEARGWKRLRADEVPPPPGPGWMPDPSAEPEDVTIAGQRPHDSATRAGDAGRRPTVLIVDDENTVRSFLKAYLEDAGYEVCEAGDVDSALTALDAGPVDAVVLDVRMPDPMGWGRTGLEVLAFIRLHGAYAALPVMILTGHPLDPEEHQLLRRHRAHLFQKPDGYRMLLQRLDQLTAAGHLAPRGHHDRQT
jgi:two-component system, chemotaxis family, chemotaxis protein CheY